jgi:hypothetical protein
MQQDRDRLRQQIIQRRLMRHAEITHRVVIHRDAPADPAIRVMGIAEPIDFTRAADAVHRRVQPKRHQNLRIDRRPARAALTGADPSVERRQIQPLDKAPDEAGGVPRRQQRLEITRLQFDLGPVGRFVARGRVRGPVRRFAGLNVRKQRIAHAPQPSTTRIGTQDSLQSPVGFLHRL